MTTPNRVISKHADAYAIESDTSTPAKKNIGRKKDKEGRENNEMEDDSDEENDLIPAHDVLPKLCEHFLGNPTPAKFAHYGTIQDPPNPGLYITGHGQIYFPVSARYIDRIMTASRAADFEELGFEVLGENSRGRGHEAAVEKTQSTCWEVPANLLVFDNPGWQRRVASIVETIKKQFNIRDKADIKATPVALILYGEGSSPKHPDR